MCHQHLWYKLVKASQKRYRAVVLQSKMFIYFGNQNYKIVKVRKTTRSGGWIMFLETSSFTFWRTVLRFRVWISSESEWVQSLCAADKYKEQKKKQHKQLYRFLPQIGSSPVLLALPRRVPLKCNLKLQVAQSQKKETYLCSRTPPRDFYAQSHKKETSRLKDNYKRLPLLNHNWKRLLNNYKELNKVLNTWYTIRGIHNTAGNRTDSVFLDT